MKKTDKYYESLDKRSREYKNWKKRKEAEGLLKDDKLKQQEGVGDIVEKVTEATGVKKVVKALFGDDCGCDERKEKLNEKKLTLKVVNCPTEEEFNTIIDFRGNERAILVRSMFRIYNRIFGANESNLSCPSCVAKVKKNLYKLVE